MSFKIESQWTDVEKLYFKKKNLWHISYFKRLLKSKKALKLYVLVPAENIAYMLRTLWLTGITRILIINLILYIIIILYLFESDWIFCRFIFSLIWFLVIYVYMFNTFNVCSEYKK